MQLPTTQNSTLTWQQNALRFHFHVNDEAALARARRILGYWTDETLPPDRAEPIDIIMSARPDGNGFVFYPSQRFSPTIQTAPPAPPDDDAKPQPYRVRDLTNLIRAAETDAALAVLNHTQYFTTAHGALLARNGKALLIVGPSQAGKSTTACHLWANGWQLLADDTALLDPATGLAAPLMRRVQLRFPSRQHLPADLWTNMLTATTCDETEEGYIFHPDEIQGYSRMQRLPLAAIVFLKRRGAPTDLPPAALRPMPPIQTLLSLAPYTNIVRKHDMGYTMNHLTPLVNPIPGYDMARGSIDDMMKSLTNLMESNADAYHR